MSGPIEEHYFIWLCAKVLPPNSFDYQGLLNFLHRTEFVWFVPGDENRAAEGMELRFDFLRETNIFREPGWFDCPCSVLELLIGLSNQAQFQTGMPSHEWFWQIMRNLGLDDYRRISENDIPTIQAILNTFMNREYSMNGHGGLFPMRMPHHDQRKVEIWYQFCEYVQDQHLI